MVGERRSRIRYRHAQRSARSAGHHDARRRTSPALCPARQFHLALSCGVGIRYRPCRRGLSIRMVLRRICVGRHWTRRMVLAATAFQGGAMTGTRTVDVSALPAYDISNRSPLWWGQLLMCGIEASLFFMLIAMYFYIRLGVDVWPPPMVRVPGVLMPTIALIPLIASCLGSYWASEAAKKDDRAGMIFGMG